MANQTDLAELKLEQEKQQTELSNTSEKIAAIEAEKRRRQEEQEEKQREFEGLQLKREACQQWIARTEKDLLELKATVARLVDIACKDYSSPAIFHLKDLLQKLVVEEVQVQTFKDCEASLRAKIEAHSTGKKSL